jgi:hypothetical protein
MEYDTTKSTHELCKEEKEKQYVWFFKKKKMRTWLWICS